MATQRQFSSDKLSFAERVFGLVGGDLSDCFRPAWAAATSSFLPLMGKLSSEIGQYLFFRDDRKGNGPVDARVWVAPLDFPDDGIDKLGIGIRMHLGSTYEPGDQFFFDMSAKVLRYLKTFQVTAELVEAEMREPATRTRRFEFYLKERQLLQAFLFHLERSENEKAKSLLPLANSISRSNSSIDSLRKKTQDLLPDLLKIEEFRRLREQLISDQLFVSGLANQLYVCGLLGK